jgi:broad specificity phosphatase PhoE
MTRRCFLAFLLVFVGLSAHSTADAQAKPDSPEKNAKPRVTTIYLVRHAEKDTAASPTDPPLSTEGQVRAQALSKLLARRKPTALFTTDTKRTRATLAPLAAATRVAPQAYDARQPEALAARICREYPGQTLVVVGHSNTLLPLIKALGVSLPVAEIADDEFDSVFTVRLGDGTPPTVELSRYGAARKPAKSGAKPMGNTMK